MSRLEKTIEQAGNRLLRANFGMKNWKSEVLETGFPDRMYMPPKNVRRNKGKVCFIEWKRPGKEPRVEQVNRINQLRSAGVPVAVFDDENAALLWVADLYGLTI